MTTPPLTFEEISNICDALATHIEKLNKLYGTKYVPLRDMPTNERIRKFIDLRSKMLVLAKELETK